MDREFLFRGKRVDNGEWVAGGYAEFEGKSYIVVIYRVPDEEGIKTGIVEVIPETVCQYINYTDIREHKACEHDIVFYEDGGCYGRIIFKEGQFLIEWKSRPDLRSEVHFWFTERRMYIVGNIFDNPSILEGGES